MRNSLREQLLPLLGLGIAAVAIPAAVEVGIGRSTVHVDGHVHFFAVGFTALAAAAASVALTIVGARFADTRTVLIGAAFAVMAALLALHGLSTPGILFSKEHYGVVMLTGGATLPAGGLILALSVMPLPARLRGVRPLLILECVMLSLVVVLGAVGLAVPRFLPEVPNANSLGAVVVLGCGIAIYGMLIMRALRTFLLTRRLSDLLVVVGLAWLAIALVAALTMTSTELGWWLGHGLELDGILVVGIPVAVDLAQTAQSRPLAGDLHAADLVVSEEVFLGSHVRAITLRLAQRDGYTEQHTRRVALRAVQVGEALGLSTRRLRALAIGGLVHDIGKLSVPNAILKKPGPLDQDEYRVIQMHVEWGVKLLEELGGFSASVRRLVHNHHERLDGGGYPRGLSAEEIDLDTRILTTCDVYDALISSRVYRPAWSHDDAIGLLRSQAGTAFDPRCVDALEAVLRREAPPAAATQSPMAVAPGIAASTPA
ncbi:MAG: HD-GYP domain-containing protein [Actinomycetes bacterium]